MQLCLKSFRVRVTLFVPDGLKFFGIEKATHRKACVYVAIWFSSWSTVYPEFGGKGDDI